MLVQPIELHGFSDASSKVYAAVVYLRKVKRSGEIEVSLIASKTRVAPINQRQSIPRLELLGATILASLVNSIQKALSSLLLVTEVFTGLTHIQCYAGFETTKHGSHVQHRISEIRKLSDVN